LIPLAATVAYVRPDSLLATHRSAISLEIEDGRASGFHLATSRTRNLHFRRI
jgi:hypothetical protein